MFKNKHCIIILLNKQHHRSAKHKNGQSFVSQWSLQIINLINKVMNDSSQEKDTLSDFCNLLQSRNYQEARSLLECKQEAFQSLSKNVCSECESHAAAAGVCFCNVFSATSCNISEYFYFIWIWRSNNAMLERNNVVAVIPIGKSNFPTLCYCDWNRTLG